jgi:propionyl-CoA synthetase
MSRYEETYQDWQDDPVAFWAKAGEQIDWFTPATAVFNRDSGVYGRWFDGATCNTCYNCVDHHVDAGHGARAALIYDSPVTGAQATYTYAELQTQVGALASVLCGLGVTKGDRVVIYMPMVAQAIFAMLAFARLGAVHSVVFGGFAAQEMATRIDDAAPRVVISASCGIEPARVVAYKPLLD